MNTEEMKLQEDRFCGRLVENLAAVEGGGTIERSDCVAELRRLTGGTLLRGQLEGRYPLGRTMWVRISPKGGLFAKRAQPMVLKGLSLIRPERLVELGLDDEPMDMSRLNSELCSESDWAGRNVCRVVLGLFSPTGWSDEAIGYVRNEPTGSGWASAVVHPLLIGPDITDIVSSRSDEFAARYAGVFCGLTQAERKEICRQQLQRDVLVKEFAVLENTASENGLEPAIVRQIAREIVSESKQYAIKKISGVGSVLKRINK